MKETEAKLLFVREYAEREGISTQGANLRKPRLRRPNGESAVTSVEGIARIYEDAIWTPGKGGARLGSHWKKNARKKAKKAGKKVKK